VAVCRPEEGRGLEPGVLSPSPQDRLEEPKQNPVVCADDDVFPRQQRSPPDSDCSSGQQLVACDSPTSSSVHTDVVSSVGRGRLLSPRRAVSVMECVADPVGPAVVGHQPIYVLRFGCVGSISHDHQAHADHHSDEKEDLWCPHNKISVDVAMIDNLSC
jgi:hypothetical protein